MRKILVNLGLTSVPKVQLIFHCFDPNFIAGGSFFIFFKLTHFHKNKFCQPHKFSIKLQFLISDLFSLVCTSLLSRTATLIYLIVY